jgi:succinyl-CoA:acetate CoA-transferase
MTDRSRLRCKATADKVMSAQEAAAFIAPGNHVGMSGFTGFGHPKAVPAALVRGVTDAAARGDRFAVSVWTGRLPRLSWMARWRPSTGSTWACPTSPTR